MMHAYGIPSTGMNDPRLQRAVDYSIRRHGELSDPKDDLDPELAIFRKR